MDKPDSNIVEFPDGRRKRESAAARRAAAAVERAGSIAKIEPEPRPQRAAVAAFTVLAIIALLVAALYPDNPDGALRWQAAFAFVVAILMGGAAILYRYARPFWR